MYHQIAVMTPEQFLSLVREGVRMEIGEFMRESVKTVEAMNEKQAAAYIGRKPITIRQWRGMSRGPKFIKQGRQVVYLKKDLDAWLDANSILTSEAPDALHL